MTKLLKGFGSNKLIDNYNNFYINTCKNKSFYSSQLLRTLNTIFILQSTKIEVGHKSFKKIE